MKKAVICIVLCALVIGFAANAFAQRKIRIAVLRFEDNSPTSWWDSRKLGDAAADVFVTELLNTGKFSVIERNRISNVLSEHNLVATGGITPQSAVELGKLLGAEVLLLGSITEFGSERYGGRINYRFRGEMYRYTCKIDIRAVNAQTAEILYANRETGSHIDIGVGIKSFSAGRESDYGRVAGKTMEGAVKKLVSEIAGQTLDWVASMGFGRVASADGSEVYINRGTSDGVSVGDRFEVWRLGAKIIDPETGQALGQKKERVGVIEVTSAESRFSICRIVEGAAAQGDMIKQ